MRAIGFFFVFGLLLACSSGDKDTVFEVLPIQIKFPCNIDTVISIRDGINLKISSKSFECLAETKSIKINLWIATSKAEMIKNRLSTLSADQRILESLGMVRLESETQINQLFPVEIEFPKKGQDAGWSSFKLESGLNTWQELVDEQSGSNINMEFEEEEILDPQFSYNYTYDEDGNVIDSSREQLWPSELISKEFNYLMKVYDNSWYNVDRFLNSEEVISTPQLSLEGYQADRTFAIIAFKNREVVLRFEASGKTLFLAGSQNKRTIVWPKDEPLTLVAFQIDNKGHLSKAAFLNTIFSIESNKYDLELREMDAIEFERRIENL